MINLLSEKLIEVSKMIEIETEKKIKSKIFINHYF